MSFIVSGVFHNNRNLPARVWVVPEIQQKRGLKWTEYQILGCAAFCSVKEFSVYRENLLFHASRPRTEFLDSCSQYHHIPSKALPCALAPLPIRMGKTHCCVKTLPCFTHSRLKTLSREQTALHQHRPTGRNGLHPLWSGWWTWTSQPPWVILARGLLRWEFNLVLSNAKQELRLSATPCLGELWTKSMKLLQQKIKREKQSFLQQCQSYTKSSSGVWSDRTQSFIHRVFDKSYSSWASPSWSHLAFCFQLWQVYVLLLAGFVPRNTQGVPVILKRRNICVLFFPKCFGS